MTAQSRSGVERMDRQTRRNRADALMEAVLCLAIAALFAATVGAVVMVTMAWLGW